MSDISLFARARAGDRVARSELLAMHVGIVHFVARRLARALSDEVELDDLVSAGHFGLIAAVEHFDESRGLAFTTFATTRVRGAMLDELRRQDRVPRSVRAKARELQAVRSALANDLGRRPTDAEIARAADMPLEMLWRWQHDVDRAGQVSLDAPVTTGRDGIASIGDRLPCGMTNPADAAVHGDTCDRLRAAVAELPESERKVVAMSFFEERTLQEIAPALGVSESRVSQIRTRALERLREHLTERGLAAAYAA